MAGHSRRKLTSRRVGKRVENKRYRAADKQVIDGGHSRLIRYDRWSMRPRQPLSTDFEADDADADVEMYYPSAALEKKPGPKSKRGPYCPAREGQKHHHFLTDTREVPNWPGFGKVFNHPLPPTLAEKLGARYHTETYKLCAYCGEERIVRRR